MSNESSNAVSPVVAVILMVAVTVILSAVIGTFVLDLGSKATKQSVDQQAISSKTQPNQVTLTNLGDEVETDSLAIRVSTGNGVATVYPNNTTTGNLNITYTGEFFSGNWSPGEEVTIQVLDPYSGEATASLVDTESETIVQSESVPKQPADGQYRTCLEVLQAGENTGDGNYTISPSGADSNITAYCDFYPSQPNTSTVYTLYFVRSGITTDEVSDNNTCKENGLVLFAPRTPGEYDVGRSYVTSAYPNSVDNGYEGGLGPLGVYANNSTWDGDSTNLALNDSEMGVDGWKSTAGSNWWGSDLTNVTEPNGDYHTRHWLGIDYDADGDVMWYNDGSDDYDYSQYLCIHPNYKEY